MKTQKIITVKPQGYCGGVLKAIETAKQTRDTYPNKKITIPVFRGLHHECLEAILRKS